MSMSISLCWMMDTDVSSGIDMDMEITSTGRASSRIIDATLISLVSMDIDNVPGGMLAPPSPIAIIDMDISLKTSIIDPTSLLSSMDIVDRRNSNVGIMDMTTSVPSPSSSSTSTLSTDMITATSSHMMRCFSPPTGADKITRQHHSLKKKGEGGGSVVVDGIVRMGVDDGSGDPPDRGMRFHAYIHTGGTKFLDHKE